MEPTDTAAPLLQTSVLAALAEGGGAVVVATLAGELLFATREARRLLGHAPAEVLWGRSPGRLGSAGAEAAFHLVSFLVEGDDDDLSDATLDLPGAAVASLPTQPRGPLDTGTFAPPREFLETGRFAPPPDATDRWESSRAPTPPAFPRPSLAELSTPSPPSEPSGSFPPTPEDVDSGGFGPLVDMEPGTLPPGHEALALSPEVVLGPDPDAPRLVGSRHATEDGDVLVLRLLPPAPSVRTRSTGRKDLHARLARELRLRAAEPNHVPVVVTIEVTNHALVHDSLGPSAADAYLFGLEHRLLEVLDDAGRLGRLEGPVFGVILIADGPDPEAASADVNRISAAIGAPIRLGDRTIQPAIKVGFSVPRTDEPTADDMLRDAAIARRRSNAFRTRPATAFVESMQSESRVRLDLENDLPGAVGRGEMELHYQPVVDLRSRHLWGFEALLRWRRPEGLLMPSRFVHIAEETGDIRALGLWVLKAGIAQISEWRARTRRQVHLSLNISPRQLGAPDLASRVDAMLRHYRVPGSLLEVEVTESLLIEAPEAANRTLNGLRALGVRVALDDFGTGYASIEQLHRFPFDVLKADRYFVQRLPGSDTDQRLVRTIHTLARALDLRLVAEGVETVEQASLLRELGCERAQGYLFGRPMMARDAVDLIVTRDPFPGALPPPTQ